MVVLETVVWKPPLSFLLSCDSVVSPAQSTFPTGLDRKCVSSVLAATHAFWGQWDSSRFIKLAQVVEFGVREARKYGGFEGGSGAEQPSVSLLLLLGFKCSQQAGDKAAEIT